MTDMGSSFNKCSLIKSIPQFDTSKVKSIADMCYLCIELETIPLLDFGSVNETRAQFGGKDTFNGCSNLKNLGGFKDLGKAYTEQTENNYQYKLTLSSSTKLTHDSLMNVINNLYDLNLNTNLSVDGVCQYRQQLTLGSKNLEKLTAEEIAIATNKGWNVN